MTTPDIPQWLSSLKTKYPKNYRPPQKVALQVGAICRALPMDCTEDNALVLVVASDKNSYSHTVVLLTPDIELATDKDILLPSDITGLPYEVLAQTDLFAYLWEVQLEPVVALPREFFLEISKRDADPGMHPEHEKEHEKKEHEENRLPLELQAGPALVSSTDPRWRNKLNELDRLGVLTGECTRQLIDGEEEDVFVDPTSLRPEQSAVDDLDLFDYVLELMDGIASGEVKIPAWLAVALISDAELERRYRASGLYAAYEALVRMLNEYLTSADLDEFDISIDSPEGLDLIGLRNALLQQRVQAGYTSVELFRRHCDVTPTAVAEPCVVGTQLVQCISIPCHE